MKKSIVIKSVVIVLALMLILAALAACSAWYSATHCRVTEYTLSAPVAQPLRLVQLSDLHNAVFGEENEDLIREVRALQPDLIFTTGDMLNSDEEETDTMISLLEKLVEIAPVYVSYGNHETSWQKNFGQELRPIIEATGAVVLDTEYLDLELKGSAIRLGGYAGYYRAPVMTTSDPKQQWADDCFADEFEDTDRYRILLSHVPTVWLDWEYRYDYGVDLVFCGHYHGGQICLPAVGGMYAPNIGWFPAYTKGLFNDKGAAVVLSAGLGSTKGLPRINNPGEIVCLDLIPEK